MSYRLVADHLKVGTSMPCRDPALEKDLASLRELVNLAFVDDGKRFQRIEYMSSADLADSLEELELNSMIRDLLAKVKVRLEAGREERLRQKSVGKVTNNFGARHVKISGGDYVENLSGNHIGRVQGDNMGSMNTGAGASFGDRQMNIQSSDMRVSSPSGQGAGWGECSRNVGEVDLCLEVRLRSLKKEAQLEFLLSRLPASEEELSRPLFKQLPGEPEVFFRDRLAKLWTGNKRQSISALQVMQHLLADHLVPSRLVAQLEDQVHEGENLLVRTALSAIPWELIPIRMARLEASRVAVCEVLDCCRGLSDLPLLARAGGRTLGVVRAEAQDAGDEAFLQREAALFDRFDGDGRRVIRISPTREAFVQALQEHSFDVLHFAGHGRVGHLSNSFRLASGESLTSEEIGKVLSDEGHQRPLVFMNSCHGGSHRLDELGVGGFAWQVLRAGALGFIGPQWEVPAEGAGRFAEAFYREWFRGQTLGRAVRLARGALDRPGDRITALSYVAYGHPAARVSVGESR